jgi:hypothetical protein
MAESRTGSTDATLAVYVWERVRRRLVFYERRTIFNEGVSTCGVNPQDKIESKTNLTLQWRQSSCIYGLTLAEEIRELLSLRLSESVVCEYTDYT